MATCCSYKTLKILSCCQKYLQICLTCTGKSGAEHSRHLKQSLGVWSGLHGADWYIEARVKKHHWYMPSTTGQAGYGWAYLQPGASHPTQKTPKSSTIFLLNGLYLHGDTRDWTPFQQHKQVEWLYLQVIKTFPFTTWRNRVSVPTRIHLIITVLLCATCIHEFFLPATSHTFMWLHSLNAPKTTFYQPPRHLPVPPRQRCSQWLATHQHYLHTIHTLLNQFIFLDRLDPDDRGSKLIQNISNNSNDTVCYTRTLVSSKMSLLQYLLVCLLSYHASLNVWVVPVLQINMSDTGNRHSWLDVCIPQKYTPCTNRHQTSRAQ
jgi:hypothetical protein